MTLDTRKVDITSEQTPVLRDWMRRLLIPLTVLAWGALIFVVFLLAGHVVETLILIAVAILIAYALSPAVNRLNRFMPRWLAIVIAYFVFGSALGAFLYVIVNTVARELSALSAYVQRELANSQVQSLLHRFGISSSSLSGGGAGVGGVASIAGSIIPVVTGVANVVVSIIVILVLSIYFVADGPRIGRWLRTQMPTTQRERTTYFLETVNRIVGGYIRGQVTLAALVGVLVGFGMFFLFHLPFAALLGLLAFVLEFIPFLGVIVSGAACVLVALSQGILVAVLVLGYFVIIHIIEGDVVGPRIVGRFVGLHPAVSLVALIAGAELFGVWGAVFAAPVAGLAQALVETFWMEYRRIHPERFPDVAIAPISADASGDRHPGPGTSSGAGNAHSQRFRGIFFRRPPRAPRTPTSPRTPAHT